MNVPCDRLGIGCNILQPQHPAPGMAENVPALHLKETTDRLDVFQQGRYGVALHLFRFRLVGEFELETFRFAASALIEVDHVQLAFDGASPGVKHVSREAGSTVQQEDVGVAFILTAHPKV